MIAASLYITLCSARNRVRVRLRRLREPRYLFGAIVGAAYLYFAVFARMAGRRGRVRLGPPPDMSLRLQTVGPLVAALVVFVLAVLTWVVPATGAMLSLSDAEAAFLLPAPLSRRQLVAHRLIRAQIGALFAGLIMAFAVPAAGLGRLRVMLSTWLFFVTARTYVAGVALARTRIALEPKRLARWVPVGILGAAVLVVGAFIIREWMLPASSVADVIDRASHIADAGPVQVILAPFLTLVRPVFTPWSLSLALWWIASALTAAATIGWTLSNASAMDVILEAPPANRAAREAPAQPARAARVWTPWQLAARGRTEGLFAWKGALLIVRSASLGTLRYLIPLASMAVIAGSTALRGGGYHGAAAFVATLATMIAAGTILFGPQVARFDLREDFKNIEVLKTWPVSPAAVVRGEMLAPIALVTAICWAAIATAWLFAAAATPNLGVAWRASIAIAAAIAAPALIGGQFAVHNVFALLFPAWVSVGNERPRGIDAMGQRLILLAAVILSLIVIALPGALAAGILWLAFQRLIGAPTLVPAALVFTVVVAIEVAIISELLGPAYERLDVMSIERGE